MSKLIIEFYNVDYNEYGIDYDKCEQIADDFAVKFADWKDKNYWQSDDNYNVYYKSINELREGKIYNITELLQIFKEKYYE
jgi:hypothetical protein